MRLIPDNINIKFTKYKKITLCISIIFIILSISLIFFRGVNLGLDFTGGILIEIRSKSISIPELNTELKRRNIVAEIVRSDKDLIIRFKDGKRIGEVKDLLEKKLDKSVVYRKIDYVGPQVSAKQIISGVFAMLFALVGMFFYIWFRFDWKFGFGGVLALIHDVILSIGFISLTGIEFNISSIAALLTIIGYSINDTMVIYDRIREYIKEGEVNSTIIDTSINSTLSRTILTSCTTLLAALPLILICKGIVRDFSLVIFFGILVGTYSSIFISSPILTYKKNDI
ncbi:protein translocase subunit SecF [Wolbachia endosymbiont of Pentidionis agamae]|uniref:protein translocase subunit SecF n=1 Tax=Wolbachia endosymbiont of Pentidionis agamae TaxID=3110435 RepID=UPI002FD30DC3